MFGGQDQEDDDIWSSMFGKKKEPTIASSMGIGNKQGSIMGKISGKESSTLDAVKSAVPGFQEEPACAKLCPNLSFKHVSLF